MFQVLCLDGIGLGAGGGLHLVLLQIVGMLNLGVVLLDVWSSAARRLLIDGVAHIVRLLLLGNGSNKERKQGLQPRALGAPIL